jgi:hypothetical protein
MATRAVPAFQVLSGAAAGCADTALFAGAASAVTTIKSAIKSAGGRVNGRLEILQG